MIFKPHNAPQSNVIAADQITPFDKLSPSNTKCLYPPMSLSSRQPRPALLAALLGLSATLSSAKYLNFTNAPTRVVKGQTYPVVWYGDEPPFYLQVVKPDGSDREQLLGSPPYPSARTLFRVLI
jgi:hypothetical protein